MDYAKHMTATQSEQAHPDQRKNNAGGFSFTLDRWKRLDRFLILGSEGGTYYVKERELTRDNARVLQECLADNAVRTVERIAEVSTRGLAPKNDAAVFALALALSCDQPVARTLAAARLKDVCRTGTHLFQFVQQVDQLRGWGRGLKHAISGWYNQHTPDELAYQLAKYQSRHGWSHRDLLRRCHDHSAPESHHAALRWAIGADLAARVVERKGTGRTSAYPAVTTALPRILEGYDAAKAAAGDPLRVSKMIDEYGLTHEMIPNDVKNSPLVWEALLERMPMHATVRNLGKMTSVGLVNPLSAATNKIVSRLSNPEQIRRARMHPIALLSAMRVYAQGHGEKGSLKWTPDQRVVDALNDAFYLAFETIVPTGKRIVLALDVSGSMTGTPVAGLPGLDARMVSSAMAMATARTEKNYTVMAFSSGFIRLDISPKQRLDDIVKSTARLPFEGTDCSLPMIWARAQDIEADVFVVYTDSETWQGHEHPHVALERYRDKTGIPAKLAVCGVASTEFTIANPNDAGMLDVVGFSSDCPSLLADFIRGE